MLLPVCWITRRHAPYCTQEMFLRQAVADLAASEKARALERTRADDACVRADTLATQLAERQHAEEVCRHIVVFSAVSFA